MRSIRVTDEMVKAREAIGGYPFVRICPIASRPGMVEVQRVTHATALPNGQWQLDRWAPPIVRQGTTQELEELDSLRSTLEREAAKFIDNIPTSESLMGRLAQLRGDQEKRSLTVVCGCIEDPANAKPCSDEEESSCTYGPTLISSLTDRFERTRHRPAGCPRRVAYLAKRSLSTDEMRGRCVKRRIPADITQRLCGPRELIEERPALLKAREFPNSNKTFLVLSGTNQAGKSFAAGSWLASLGKGGLFVTQFDIKCAIMPDPENKAYDLIRTAQEASALVIDNVEASISDAVKEVIEGLVIKFHGAARKVAFTTSLDIADFMNLWRNPRTETGPVFERLMKYGMFAEVPGWPT